MVKMTVERLNDAKRAIENGLLNCDSESLTEGLDVTTEAMEWLKANHYQLKVVETFGPTGLAVLIYPQY